MYFFYSDMKFEHEKLLKGLRDCPPKNYQSINIDAYRWFFAVDDPRNFQSAYEKKPARFNDSSDTLKCKAMGLSMLDSAEKAEERYLFLRDIQNYDARVLFGEFIAEGFIASGDGVSEVPPEKNGHFTHHPAEAVDYSKRFQIIASFLSTNA